MSLYAFRLSLDHQSFRIPSLLSIAQTFEFPLKFVSQDLTRSILVIELEKEEYAQHILDRGTLVIWAVRLYAEGASYPELHDQLKANKGLWEGDMDKTFRIKIEDINHKIPESRQRDIISGFSWMELRGKADLKKPEVELVVMEDYDLELKGTHLADYRAARDGKFKRLYFGSRLGYSKGRTLVSAHNVKTRAYYGNTSMDAEMGFLMALQTLPKAGKIIYDPFVGTGSMLYAVAHFGAYVIGSDIDGRQMRGKAKGKGVVPGILRSAEQYGVADKFLDFAMFDITKGPFRQGGWLDAIITDPPYGVRAGAKRLGKKEGRKPALEEAWILPDGTAAHMREGYVPPCRPYELANLTIDLVLLARWLLVPGGRLVFFLPTVTEDYQPVDIPVVEGMRELKVGEGSVQEFSRWGRRLITMEKVGVYNGPPPTFEDHSVFANGESLPGHFDFRGRLYLSGFLPRDADHPAYANGNAAKESGAQTPNGSMP